MTRPPSAAMLASGQRSENFLGTVLRLCWTVVVDTTQSNIAVLRFLLLPRTRRGEIAIHLRALGEVRRVGPFACVRGPLRRGQGVIGQGLRRGALAERLAQGFVTRLLLGCCELRGHSIMVDLGRVQHAGQPHLGQLGSLQRLS